MADEPQRYDVLLTPSNPGYKAPDAAIMKLVQTIAYRRFAVPVDEAIHKDWVEVYMEPGPQAYEMFIDTGYDGPLPVYKELMLRAGKTPVRSEYGPVGKDLFLTIEVRGCVFTSTQGPFWKLIFDTLNLRVSNYHREASGELFERKVVAPEDAPPDKKKKKKERGPGTAGIECDEW